MVKKRWNSLDNQKWEIKMWKRLLVKQLELWEGVSVSECEEKHAPNWQLNYKPGNRSGNKNKGESHLNQKGILRNPESSEGLSCAVLIPPKNRWWWQSNNLKKLKQWYKPVFYIQAKILFSYDSSEKTRLNSQVHWIPCSWTESNLTTRQDKTKWECGVNRGMMCYLC